MAIFLGQKEETTLDDYFVACAGGQYLRVRYQATDKDLTTASHWTTYIGNNGAVNGTYDRTADTWYTDVNITSGKGNLVNIISPTNLTSGTEWDLKVTVDGVVYEKLGLTMPAQAPSYPKMIYGPGLSNVHTYDGGFSNWLIADDEPIWINNNTTTPGVVFNYMNQTLPWQIIHPLKAAQIFKTIAFEQSLKVEQRMSNTGPSSGYAGMAWSGATYILRS
jgi:hypothetical protein